MEKILIIGSNGQLGTELTAALAKIHGTENVFAADIQARSDSSTVQCFKLDVLDAAALSEIVSKCGITQIYQLAAMLSATGEKFPLKAWNLNMQGLINTLELARHSSVERVFWPSSIAAFGPHTPRLETPQLAVMDPNTMYGISKQAGERICEYYHMKYGIDVRSIRYPGIISYAHPPGGGTTDYAIDIFQAAKNRQVFTCFLDQHTCLPMIYMPDAIRATLELMSAASKTIRVRSSYNVAGVSFSPAEITQQIRTVHPDFAVKYAPDFRQAIAESWPQSLDDAAASRDWGWKAEFDLAHIVHDMLQNIPASWPGSAMLGNELAAA